MPSTVQSTPSAGDVHPTHGSKHVGWRRGARLSLEVEEPDCLFRLQCLDGLRETIHPALQEVVDGIAVPALCRRHRTVALDLPIDGHAIARHQVERLARELLSPTGADSRQLASGCLADGVSVDLVLLGLMREAEALVERWFERDACSSLDVTLAACRLRTLALELTRGRYRGTRQRIGADRRGCIIAPPGDALRYDSVLHECYLRMAGWEIEKLEGRPLDEVAWQLRETGVDLALCVLNDVSLRAEATGLVREARVRAGDRAPLFLGTGAGFAPDVHSPARVGLDAIVLEPAVTLLYAAQHSNERSATLRNGSFEAVAGGLIPGLRST